MKQISTAIAALGQDVGSKERCIAELKKGYAADHILMTGDAHGDEKAAEVNGVRCYPILVNPEGGALSVF